MSTSTLKVSDHFHVLHSLGSKRKHCTISGCTVSYAYETSTTILKRHLTKVHLLHVVDAEDELPSTPSSASFSPSLSFSPLSTSASTIKKTVVLQPSITTALKSSVSNSQLYDALAKVFAILNIPDHVVESVHSHFNFICIYKF